MSYSNQTQPEIRTAEEIQAFLVEKMALVLRTTPDQIDINDDLVTYGLDSLDAMTIMGQLSSRCGQDIDFDVVWEYPTIASVTEYVVKQLKESS